MPNKGFIYLFISVGSVGLNGQVASLYIELVISDIEIELIHKATSRTICGTLLVRYTA